MDDSTPRWRMLGWQLYICHKFKEFSPLLAYIDIVKLNVNLIIISFMELVSFINYQ